jgi:small-conductance mechanosensitive channel
MDSNYMNWFLSSLVLIAYLFGSGTTSRVLTRIGERKMAAPKRAKYISKVFNFAIALLSLFILFFIWGVDYHGILVFGSSVLAIGGVALFAQWSILSNLTASIVIFFYYPARIGDRIRIVDGDNSLEGTIIDITMFQVLIEDDGLNLINYPNNLLIQKPLIKLDAGHHHPQA